jgi:hypothetical protein
MIALNSCIVALPSQNCECTCKQHPRRALQLRAVAAALRKSDDVAGVLAALPRVEVLVRAAPDELPVVAPELSRALLHCRVPEWAEPDPGTP